MHRLLFSTLFFGVSFFSPNLLALTCGPQQVNLVELYTSQGCSSCPPAEKWLNQYKESDDLWTSVVPVAFHVDYWDYLGWKDAFAQEAHSQRQRKHKVLGNLRSVYTPGLVVNGQEWRGLFSGKHDIPRATNKPGSLHLRFKDDNLHINFDSVAAKPSQFHIAWLRMDYVAKVGGGENSGRSLPQEISVLEHIKSDWNAEGATVTIPTQISPEAVAVWLSDDTWQPVQACGSLIGAAQ